MVISFTRYVHSKLIEMLYLYCHESMGKYEEREEIEYLTVIDYMLGKESDKIKEINRHWKNLDDTKILIDMDDKLQDAITLKNPMILMTSVIKEDGKFYPQIF